jgi:hypothetical protein
MLSDRLSDRGPEMPLTPYLQGAGLDDEATRVAKVAFAIVRVALGTPDLNDPITQTIATRTIELAQAGQRNADLLAEQVLADCRQQPQFQAATRPRSILERLTRMFKAS